MAEGSEGGRGEAGGLGTGQDGDDRTGRERVQEDESKALAERAIAPGADRRREGGREGGQERQGVRAPVLSGRFESCAALGFLLVGKPRAKMRLLLLEGAIGIISMGGLGQSVGAGAGRGAAAYLSLLTPMLLLAAAAAAAAAVVLVLVVRPGCSVVPLPLLRLHQCCSGAVFCRC